MYEVVVLGGYGRLGRFCVHHLIESTQANLVVAGHNVQRAESVALQYEQRARAAYAEASDPRTLHRLLEGASLLIACSGGDSAAVLDTCLQMRVPFIGVTPTTLDVRQAELVGEMAWKANVPVVLQAGALPGLPGVLAEALVRRFPSIPEIRIASTGPWMETETAQRDVRAFYDRVEIEAGSTMERLMPLSWDFEAPVGPRPVRRRASADLHDFLGSHCVESLVYLEPSFGGVTRSLDRLRRRKEPPRFALAAEALLEPTSGTPDACIEISAPHPLLPAAAAVRVLAEARFAGELPSGLLTPREAVNPTTMLGGLEKSGVQVLWD